MAYVQKDHNNQCNPEAHVFSGIVTLLLYNIKVIVSVHDETTKSNFIHNLYIMHYYYDSYYDQTIIDIIWPIYGG